MASNDKISNMTAAVIGDIAATTTAFEVTTLLTTTPTTKRLTAGVLASWLAATGLNTSTLVFTSGKIAMGTTPGSAGAINVDASTYASGVGVSLLHTSESFSMRQTSATVGSFVMSSATGVIRISPNAGAVSMQFASAANTTILTTSTYSLTGSNASTGFDFSGATNTSGNPVVFKLAISSTAVGSTTASLLMQLLAGASGTTNIFSVSFSGIVTTAASILAGADMRAGGTASAIYWNGSSVMRAATDGIITLLNNAENGFTRLNFGGTTSSFPALKRSSAAIEVRLADDSGYASFTPGVTAVQGVLSSTAGITAGSGTAITAGGSLLGHLVSSTASFGMFAGSGAPTISAAKGSIYLRSDGSGIADRLYVNTNGSTTWTNVVTAA